MNQRVHAIIGELHRLLGSFSEAELAKAAAQKEIQGPMRAVLEGLVAASRSDTATERRLNHTERKSRAIQKRLASEPLEEVILASQYGKSIAGLLELSKKYGILLEPKTKEARERFAKRLVGELAAKNTDNSKLLADLAERSTSQTQGWISLIRNQRR